MALIPAKVIAPGGTALSWEWILRADGEVSCRLTAVGGYQERNPWTEVTRLPATQMRVLRRTPGRAGTLLSAFARQRGHQTQEQLS